MSKSPMEVNPTLSPMHIDFDRDWGVKASPPSNVELFEAPEPVNSLDDDYPLEPPEEVVDLYDETADIEKINGELEDQNQLEIEADTKPNSAKSNTTKRRKVKESRPKTPK
jgi:hypothetical protein